MKKLKVNVCACTHCVMNGAMEIVESIESLQKLKTQLRLNVAVDIACDECMCDDKDGNQSVLVCINGEKIQKATGEIVAARIISLIQRKDT